MYNTSPKFEVYHGVTRYNWLIGNLWKAQTKSVNWKIDYQPYIFETEIYIRA